MLPEPRVTNSPSKNKAKEENWQYSWWDFYPLVERARRPVEWSSSSTIFTAHTSQPLVVGRVFPSPIQFILPSPPPIVASPTSYKPPTVISISSDDIWLFAYFPGREVDGVGCLWQCGGHLDSWRIEEWRSYTRGSGVVTACWSLANREWIITPNGQPLRLPSRGPSLRISGPMLFFVTENHQFNIWYFRSYTPSLQVLSCSLIFNDAARDNQNIPVHDPKVGPGGVRFCINAAIGLAYRETSILVAMRSHLYPSVPVRPSTTFNPMDLNASLDIASFGNELYPTLEWESWGEESLIEFAEVQLRSDGSLIGISSRPLPPLSLSPLPLTHIFFVPLISPLAEGTTSSQNTENQADDTAEAFGLPKMYLATSFLDFGNFSSNPKSAMFLHSISRNIEPGNRSSWTIHLDSTRSLSAGVLAYVTLCPSSFSDAYSLCAVVLNTEVSVTKRKREATIGQILRMKFPDLNEDPEWNVPHILAKVDGVGKNIPVAASISPNHILTCLSSSALSVAPSATHLLLQPVSTSHESKLLKRTILSSALVIALLSRISTADITHVLSLPLLPLDEVEDILQSTIAIFDKDTNEPSASWPREMFGVIVETYRTRALAVENSAEKSILQSRWRTAHDICSLFTCVFAFDVCDDGEGYDLQAAWHLVELSRWIMEFIEKLLKECVIFHGSSLRPPPPLPLPDESDDLFGSAPPTPHEPSSPTISPLLICFIHHAALTILQRAIGHVKQFRLYLGSQTASAEDAQIAKDILIDTVDCSGVDLPKMESILGEAIIDSKDTNLDLLQQSLAACQPVHSMEPLLRKNITKILDSRVVDKARLFLKPADLVDDVARLSLTNRRGAGADRDVMTKGMLVKPGLGVVCTRCGGKSEIGADLAIGSPSWRACENMWLSNGCVCFGRWTTSSS